MMNGCRGTEIGVGDVRRIEKEGMHLMGVLGGLCYDGSEGVQRTGGF